MIISFYRQAAENVAGEPVSIEEDGSVWVDSDHRDIDKTSVLAEYDRLMASRVQERNAAIAHAKSLGFTDDMISVMYPNLTMEA